MDMTPRNPLNIPQILFIGPSSDIEDVVIDSPVACAPSVLNHLPKVQGKRSTVPFCSGGTFQKRCLFIILFAQSPSHNISNSIGRSVHFVFSRALESLLL